MPGTNPSNASAILARTSRIGCLRRGYEQVALEAQQKRFVPWWRDGDRMASCGTREKPMTHLSAILATNSPLAPVKRLARPLIIALSLMSTAPTTRAEPPAPSNTETTTMQIRLTIGAKSAIATIDDNATARFPHHVAVNPAAGRLRRNREDHVSAEKTLDAKAPRFASTPMSVTLPTTRRGGMSPSSIGIPATPAV